MTSFPSIFVREVISPSRVTFFKYIFSQVDHPRKVRQISAGKMIFILFYGQSLLSKSYQIYFPYYHTKHRHSLLGDSKLIFYV